MSESIASFNAGPETEPGLEGRSNMPEGYESLDRIEVYKKADGSEGLRGVMKLGDKEHSTILKDEAHEIWGFDPDDKFDPQPVAAIWRNGENDTPVIINGFQGVKDGKTYYSVEDSKTGVPHDEIIWSETAPIDVESSVEYQELKARFDVLESKYTTLSQEHEDLKRRVDNLPNHDALEAEIERLSQVNAGLVIERNEALAQVSELRNNNQSQAETIEDLETRNTLLQQELDNRPYRTSRVRLLGAVVLAALAAGIGGYLIGHERGDDDHSTKTERIETGHAGTVSLSAEDRKLLLRETKAEEKTNRQNVQQIELQKNILRTERQDKKLDVQIRNNLRRLNFKVSEIPRTGSGGSTYQASAESSGGGYDYPWNWSAKQVGASKAEANLRKLGEKAKKAGHTVAWSTSTSNGKKVEILNIDGHSNSSYVTKVLNRFK